jgi:hypothetical protein
VGTDDDFVVLQAQMARDLSGMLQFAGLRFFEAERKGVHSRIPARRQSRDQRGINSAAQEQPHWHVRVEAAPDTVIENPFYVPFGGLHA